MGLGRGEAFGAAVVENGVVEGARKHRGIEFRDGLFQYRRIKLEYKAFRERVLDAPGAVEVLQLVGFQRETAPNGGGDALVVVDPSTLSAEELRFVRLAFEMCREALLAA